MSVKTWLRNAANRHTRQSDQVINERRDREDEFLRNIRVAATHSDWQGGKFILPVDCSRSTLEAVMKLKKANMIIKLIDGNIEFKKVNPDDVIKAAQAFKKAKEI